MVENRIFWDTPVCELDPEDFLTENQRQTYAEIFDKSQISPTLDSVKASLHSAGVETDIDTISDRLVALGYDLSRGVSLELFLILIIQITEKRLGAGLIDHTRYFRKSKIDDYLHLYNQFDQDQNGINVSELGNLFKQIRLNISEVRLQEIFDEADSDRSGIIEFAEFCCLFVKAIGAVKIPIPLEYFSSDRLRSLRARPSADFIGDCTKLITEESLKRYRRVTPCTAESAAKLRRESTDAVDLYEGGYQIRELLAAGYSFADCVAGGYAVTELLKIGASVSDLRSAKVGPLRLTQAGVSAYDLRMAGFSAESIRRACRASSN